MYISEKNKEWFCIITNLFAVIPTLWCIFYGQYMVGTIIITSGFISLIYHLAYSMEIFTIFGKKKDDYHYADFFLSQALFGSVILFTIIYDSNQMTIGTETQIRGTLQILNLIIAALAVKKQRDGMQPLLITLGFSFSMHFISWAAFLWFPLLQYDWIDFGIGLILILIGAYLYYLSNKEETDVEDYAILHGLWHILAFIGILFFLSMRSQERTLIFLEIWKSPYNGNGQRT